MSKITPVHVYGKVEPRGSSSTPLAGGATFTGESFEILQYGIIYVSVYSDVASATDGLSIEQSSDGTNWDHDDVFTIPAGTGKNFSINPYAKYARIIYTNGAGAQSDFRLQTILKSTGKPSAHRIQDTISNDDDAELVKSVITGEDPDGTFQNFQATRSGNFKVAVYEYGDTPSIDAFGRLRTSEPYTIFDSKQLHDDQPLFWDELVGGSATSAFSASQAAVVMTVTASASDYAQRQTKQRFNYQPGKSLLWFMTAHAPQQTGVTIRVGAFNGTSTNYMTPGNGFFLEITENDVSFNIAKNGSTTESVSQANWNYDPLDGTGPSGITLDLDGTFIMVIDMEYLGVGRLRAGFVINGLIAYCHYFNHANDPTFTSVYMLTPNLPIRYDIASDGTGGGTLDHICSTIMSEGGQQQTGVLRSVDTDGVHLDANAADTPYVCIAIRLKTTYLDITVIPEYFSMVAETNDDLLWTLCQNPTYNGTLTFNDVPNSSIQYALGATANDITDYGLKIDSGFTKSSAAIDRRFLTNLYMGSKIDGTRDVLVLAAMPLTSNSDIQSSLTVRELL